jgi:hypothetical protein
MDPNCSLPALINVVEAQQAEAAMFAIDYGNH